MSFPLCGAIAVVGALLAADEVRPLKLTVSLSGAHCEECVRVLREALGKDGARLEARDVRPGRAPEHHSSRFTIELADPARPEIGAIAKRVAEAETPHRTKASPGLFLLFPWKATATPRENVVEKNRAGIERIEGVDAKATFGGDRYVWVKLEGSGRATLREITGALAGMDLIDNPLGPPESEGWILDYAAAREAALKARKPILLVFR